MCLDTIEACGIVRREAIRSGRHRDRPLQVETIGRVVGRSLMVGSAHPTVVKMHVETGENVCV